MDHNTSTVVRQYFVNKTHQSFFIIRRNKRAVVSVLVARLVITITPDPAGTQCDIGPESCLFPSLWGGFLSWAVPSLNGKRRRANIARSGQSLQESIIIPDDVFLVPGVRDTYQ
jgi:hypothetical protein